jgi:hypothetical protein
MSEQHKIAAAKRGAAKTAKVHQQVEDAIRAITSEMKANGGIYPNNGGAVSMAELARRAGINEATFYKKGNTALKERASLWRDTLKRRETVGRMRVRKTYQQRAASWHEKYKALETRHGITELQFQQLQAKYEELQQKYEALVEQMRKDAESKVAVLPKKGKS